MYLTVILDFLNWFEWDGGLISWHQGENVLDEGFSVGHVL